MTWDLTNHVPEHLKTPFVEIYQALNRALEGCIKKAMSKSEPAEVFMEATIAACGASMAALAFIIEATAQETVNGYQISDEDFATSLAEGVLYWRKTMREHGFEKALGKTTKGN